MSDAQSPAARLVALGLTLPPVAAPVASYVPALRDGDLVLTSGQLPFVDGRLAVTGKVGTGEGLVDPETAQRLAATCALNAIAAAASVLGSVDDIARVVKVTGFVASDPSFTGQPGVVNGASDLLGEVFGGRHARSAVGVAVLPLDSPVEVEIVVRVRS
ncbi:RidA family protein [Kineococcus radiotolerans]|uniref:Endoribonuclease L-PSP n=1 Tax=Kineococcus radiotolerans (strain ATCC BAA-149 / DSM 14245 / SRS30216) TaxID=266940 RepID=A6W527_KINRD|nr:RidA family protein [Kineococcus radiotolerans]ABS01916.1 Endoribonuclease L-PSP [Kineococcus radiotolerans SRS30216 = ATCC BAA-149]